MTLPLLDWPSVWQLYAIGTFTAVFVAVVLSVVFVLPDLAHEAWQCLHVVTNRQKQSQ